MSPIVLIGFGILILVIGLGLGYLFGNTIRAREIAKASDIEADLNKYRNDVTEHFNQTAAHFQSIGQQYKDLYEHMALGAEALCEESRPGRVLPFSPDALLTSASDAESVVEEVVTDTLSAGETDVTSAEQGDAEEAPVAEKAAAVDTEEKEAAEDLAAETETSQSTTDDGRIYH
jgi:uncharacterized membrane-anchored protein YhcB (DUF1043 family)